LSDTDYINNIKYEYSYNSAGNIISRVKKDRLTENIISSDSFSYSDSTWEDLLTSYNNESITYDSIGNPLIIGTKVLTWIDGRKLDSYIDGSLSVMYKYNNDGIRTEKIVNNISIKYILEGNKVIFENRNGSVLYYYYDISGVSGIKYNNTDYFFIKNLQGDIINIVDLRNNILVRYEYDSFGNIISIKDNSGNNITDQANVGIVNPFRYRGYYYDNETGFYYLNTRYYNPLWGRFLNADGIIGANIDLLSQNLFAYCSNNYVNKVDYNGLIAIGAILKVGVKIALTAVAFCAIKAISNKVSGKKATDDIAGVFVGTLVGATLFTITKSAPVSSAIGTFISNSTNAAINTISKYVTAINNNCCPNPQIKVERELDELSAETIIDITISEMVGYGIDKFIPSYKYGNDFINEKNLTVDFLTNLGEYSDIDKINSIKTPFEDNHSMSLMKSIKAKTYIESTNGYCYISWSE